jgi:hypothetical protein
MDYLRTYLDSDASQKIGDEFAYFITTDLSCGKYKPY